MERVQIEVDVERLRPVSYKKNFNDIPSSEVVKNEENFNDIPSRGVNKFRRNTYKSVVWMLAVNEIGIYEALFASRRLEARKFRRWSASVMQRLRQQVGLQQYEVMRMTDPDIQEEIDDLLDTLFFDEETRRLMRSVTVQGGDVEQVPFEF